MSNSMNVVKGNFKGVEVKQVTHLYHNVSTLDTEM